MKVYQVVAYGGEWEDSYEYVIGTFLDKNNALKFKEYHETINNKGKNEHLLRFETCEKCPVNSRFDIKPEEFESVKIEVSKFCTIGELEYHEECQCVDCNQYCNGYCENDYYAGFNLYEYEAVEKSEINEDFLSKNINIHVIKSSSQYINEKENRDKFVKLEHMPSGITVTKYHRVLTEAKKVAMKEIEELIDLWNCI